MLNKQELLVRQEQKSVQVPEKIGHSTQTT
jgi:hypothetical protein